MTLTGSDAEGPVHDVDVVDVLFDDVVAREPGEIQPVPALPFHLGHGRRLLDDPEVALVPIALAADDLADGPAVDPLHELEIALLVAALRAGDDRQPFPGGEIGGGDDRPHADGIDRDRLLHEDVLARLDRGLEVDGPEAGRGGRDDQVDVRAGRDLQVVVEAGEHPLPGDLDLVRDGLP